MANGSQIKRAAVLLVALALTACAAGEPLPVPTGTWQPVNVSAPPATQPIAVQ